ncbi:MAG: sugar phosphate isomerase/epimerase [Oscillospiraceae bacterium]|jgi:sugar phosphate isomerase/epimerase|nr:sugar phosphate isomerase/epimerase [Oscillospiraceae bacterium]
MENRLGLATCFYPDSTPERWRTAAEAGFCDAEIDTLGRLGVEEICAMSEKIYQDLKAGGLAPTSFHLPFNNSWDISAEDDAVREKALTGLCALLQWMGSHNIPIAVLHPSYEPISDESRPARLRHAAASIKMLGEEGKKLGIRIAVEDLPRSCLGNCADELLFLTDYGRHAGICFDVNHLLKESHKEFVEKVGPYIITTHLSDYDRLDEKHWLPGDGCIDWKQLKALLDAAGYQGRYLFELGENASPLLGRAFTPKELAERFEGLLK